jgi:hypothetical protein
VTLLWIAGLGSSCKDSAHERGVRQAIEACERSGTTRDAFSTSVRTAGGEYSDSRIAALAVKAKDIKPGMTMDEVRRTLGAPSYVEAWRSKDGYDFDQCAWKYVQKGAMKTAYFIEEEWFEVDFGPDNRVLFKPAIK